MSYSNSYHPNLVITKSQKKNSQGVKLRNIGEDIVVDELDCVQSQFQEAQLVEHRKLELVLLSEEVTEQVEMCGPAGYVA